MTFSDCGVGRGQARSSCDDVERWRRRRTSTGRLTYTTMQLLIDGRSERWGHARRRRYMTSKWEFQSRVRRLSRLDVWKWSTVHLTGLSPVQNRCLRGARDAIVPARASVQRLNANVTTSRQLLDGYGCSITKTLRAVRGDDQCHQRPINTLFVSLSASARFRFPCWSNMAMIQLHRCFSRYLRLTPECHAMQTNAPCLCGLAVKGSPCISDQNSNPSGVWTVDSGLCRTDYLCKYHQCASFEICYQTVNRVPVTAPKATTYDGL